MAGKVNGIAAAHKPRPNKLLALDRSAKLPKSVIPLSLRGPRGPQGPAGVSGGLVNPYVFRAHKIAAQDALAMAGVKVVVEEGQTFFSRLSRRNRLTPRERPGAPARLIWRRRR